MLNLSDENTVAKIVVKGVLHIMAKKVKMTNTIQMISTIILFVKILEKHFMFVKNVIVSVVTKMIITHVKIMQEKNVRNAQKIYVVDVEMSAISVEMIIVVKIAC